MIKKVRQLNVKTELFLVNVCSLRGFFQFIFSPTVPEPLSLSMNIVNEKMKPY